MKPMPQKWDRYRNLKNDQKYIVIKLVTDQTNSRAGTRSVLYEDKGGDWHVRELDEFLAKFEHIQ